MVTGVVPSPPRFLPSTFIAHMVQQSHCSSIFYPVLQTHALALSASQFVHKKQTQRIYTSMHSAGLELTKLTYTKLDDNLIRPPGRPFYTRCWRAELGVRHARLRREATAVTAKAACCCCMILLCGTWYGCVGVWVCAVKYAMGSKIGCKMCSTEFFEWQIQSKKSRLSTESRSFKPQSKTIESKMHFFDGVGKPGLGFSLKWPISTDQSDCVRNGL